MNRIDKAREFRTTLDDIKATLSALDPNDTSGELQQIKDDITRIETDLANITPGNYDQEIQQINDEITAISDALSTYETSSGAQAKANAAETNAKAYADDLLADAGGGVSSWNDLTDKPSTFTPSSHTHTMMEVNGLQAALDGLETTDGAQAKADAAEQNAKSYADSVAVGGDAGPVTWGTVQDKPLVFPPDTHTHPINQVTNLQATLDSKETPAGAQSKADAALSSANSYTDAAISTVDTGPVEWSNVLNKPTTFTPSAHNHEINNITGLQTQLNQKAVKTDVDESLNEVIARMDTEKEYRQIEPEDLRTEGTETDGQLLQKAIDLVQSGGQANYSIKLSRIYHIDQAIWLDESISYNGKPHIFIQGTGGGLSLAHDGYMFDGIIFAGGIHFESVKFIGSSFAHTLINGDTLIQMTFLGCQFINIYRLLEADSETGYLQSFRFSECNFKGMQHYQIRSALAYDVVITNCYVEWGGGGLIDLTQKQSGQYATIGVVIRDNVIEGISQMSPIRITQSGRATIDGNYFEGNVYPDIDLTGGTIQHRGITITNNLFGDYPDTQGKNACIKIGLLYWDVVYDFSNNNGTQTIFDFNWQETTINMAGSMFLFNGGPSYINDGMTTLNDGRQTGGSTAPIEGDSLVYEVQTATEDATSYQIDAGAADNFVINVNENDKEIVINNTSARTGGLISLNLILNCQTANGIDMPQGIRWRNELIPTFSVGGTYMILLQSLDKGATWLGSIVGTWGVSATDPVDPDPVDPDPVDPDPVDPVDPDSPVILADNFNRANSTVNPGTADTGQTWLTSGDNQVGIVDNKLYPVVVGQSANPQAYVDLGVSTNFKVSFDYTLGHASEDSSMYFRAPSGLSGTKAGLAFWASGLDLIVHRGTGDWDLIESHEGSWAVGTTKHIELTVEGDTATVVADGTQILSGQIPASVPSAQTFFGISFYIDASTTQTRLDNLVVEVI